MQKVRRVSFDLAEDALFQEMSRTGSPLVIPDVRKDKRFRALRAPSTYGAGWELRLLPEGKSLASWPWIVAMWVISVKWMQS